MNLLKKKENWVYLIVFLIIITLIIYPMFIIVQRSFSFNDEFSLQNYLNIFTAKDTYQVLKNSLFVSITSAFFAVLIGSTLAWLVTRTNLKYKKLIQMFIIIPFLIPSFITALSWRQLLGPVGYLNKLYNLFTNTSQPLISIDGPWGIIFVLTMSSFSLVFLLTSPSFRNLDTSFEEAAQISGASKFKVMRDITFPLIRPSIISSTILVFVANISNFGVPSILGFHESYFVLTTKIYDLLNSFTATNSFSQAASLSMILIGIAIFGLWLQQYLNKQKSYSVISGKSTQKMIVELGRYKNLVSTLVIIFLFLVSVAPVIAIFLTSITRAYGLNPTIDNLTLENYSYIIFDLPMARRGIVNSLFIALVSATIAVILGTIISYFITKTDFKYKQFISYVVSLPYALPGTVIALAIILAWIRPLPVLNQSIYNTIWIIIVAYITYYLSLAVQSVSSTLIQIDGSLEEAARASGANWFQNFRDVIIPLAKPGVINGWFLIFIPAISELTISILLWSSGNETISVAVFNLQEQGNMTAASALSIVLILLIFIGNQMLRVLNRKDKKSL